MEQINKTKENESNFGIKYPIRSWYAVKQKNKMKSNQMNQILVLICH